MRSKKHRLVPAFFGAAVRRKLKGRGGFTFIEMLCAAIILVFLALAMQAGMSVASDGYYKSVLRSESGVLASSAGRALMHELRFARNIKTGEGDGFVPLVSYDSPLYGKGASVCVEDGKAYVRTSVAGDGGSVVEESYALLPDGSYGGGEWQYGFPPEGIGIGYNSEKKLFEVTVTVQELRGNGFCGIPVENVFHVEALNGGKGTGE